jgi:eukaryotic-like serine/threonine-protein kinase
MVLIFAMVSLITISVLACKKLEETKDFLTKKGIELLKKSDQKEMICPNNTVRIDKFCIDIYEYPNDIGYYPLVNKTWFQAQADCSKRGKRLCTSKEWERACKGEIESRYPYGNTYKPDACQTEGKILAMIGSHKDCRSPYGVYDMVGNAWEWTTVEGDSISSRAYGGHWNFGDAARCSMFTTLTKTHSSDNIGFRCCK